MKICFLAALALALSSLLTPPLRAAQKTPAKPSTARTNAVPAVPPNLQAPSKPAQIPQAAFAVPSSPKEGRNPFFPQSGVTKPVLAEKGKPSKQLDVSAVILNGLTGPPKRMAMINGRSFEAGESAEIRLPGGNKLRIVCEEIRDDSVLVLIANERRELRLKNTL
jgi:hypothetical protein